MVDTRSLVRLRNGPLSENVAFWSNVTGKMFVCPPGLPRNGLSRPPGGALSRTSDPHGGATDVLRWNCPFTNSYDLPYDARTDVLPSPDRIPGQARRAARSCSSRSACPPGWGSPGRRGSRGPPARWGTPCSSCRPGSAPCRTDRPRRSRAAAGRTAPTARRSSTSARGPTLQVSCAYSPTYFCSMSSVFGAAWTSAVRSHPAQQEVRQSEPGHACRRW